MCLGFLVSVLVLHQCCCLSAVVNPRMSWQQQLRAHHLLCVRAWGVQARDEEVLHELLQQNPPETLAAIAVQTGGLDVVLVLL